MKFLALFISTLLILGSCTIKKRDYLPGYHVTWHQRSFNSKLIKGKQKQEKFEIQPTVSNEPLTIETKTESDFVDLNNLIELESQTIEILPVTEENVFPVNSKWNNEVQEAACDEIILKNGNSIQAKVLEVGMDLIKYKNCDNLEGPDFTIRKSEVVMIQYKNGTRTVIEQTNWQDEEDKSDTEVLVDEIDTHLDTFGGDDKSFLVTAVLWFFLGILGIHRFYLGHIGIGVLYLLTGGLCGIGWIVDGIMLATGKLKPKNGEYIDSDSN